MTPFRAPPDYPRWPAVATLIHRSFAYMEPLLGHPPRAAAVTARDLSDAAGHGTAYLVEDAKCPIGCLFTRPSRDMPDALYVGWLAVDGTYRGRKIAQHLISAAEDEARADGYAALTLDTGRSLSDLHAFFRRAGFDDLPGEGEVITFRKSLAESPLRNGPKFGEGSA